MSKHIPSRIKATTAKVKLSIPMTKLFDCWVCEKSRTIYPGVRLEISFLTRKYGIVFFGIPNPICTKCRKALIVAINEACLERKKWIKK